MDNKEKVDRIVQDINSGKQVSFSINVPVMPECNNEKEFEVVVIKQLYDLQLGVTDRISAKKEIMKAYHSAITSQIK